MLKRSTYVLLSLLLCIPLVFIVYFSLSTDTEKPQNAGLVRVDIENKDGYGFTYSDKEDLDLYYTAVANAKKIDHPVRDVSGDTPTSVVYNELETAYPYSFYMASDSGECYYSDSAGTFYRLDQTDAQSLLSRREFAYLYEGYTLPSAVITASDGAHTLNSAEGADWHFLCGADFSEGFIPEAVDTGVIAFKQSEPLTLAFSEAPSRCEITVLRGDTVVHSGEDLAGLSDKLSYASDTPLTCEIKAEWVQTDGIPYYGSATYTASLLYDIPATYSVVDSRLSPGEFTILHFANLNDDQAVTLVSELPLPATKVHTVGDRKFVFMPVDVSAVPGKYTIKVIAGNEESSFSFTVGNKSFNEAQISTKHGSGAYDSAKAEFDALVKSLTDQSAAERLWDDNANGTYKFTSPVASAKIGTPAFGTNVIADTNLKGSTPYRTAYLTIEAAEGTSVGATATGKVVYAGENGCAGKAVILDHGFGVLSIYSNLSEISVSVGDTVAIGEALGKAGKTGYMFNSGVKFAMTMEGVYINPASNYNYGIRVSS